MKKKTLIFSFVVVFALAFTAHAGITIKGIKEYGTPHQDVMQKVIDKFKSKTGIDVKIDVMPYLTFREKMMVNLVGEIPEYDFIHFPASMMGPVYGSGKLTDLAEFDKKYNFDKKNWLPPAWAKATFKGKHLGIPFKECMFVLFYRKDLFKAKGLEPPETVLDYLHAAKVLTDPPNMYGIALQAKQAVTTSWSWWDYLYAWGGDVFDKDYRPAFNTREGEESLQFFVDMINKYKVAVPGSTTYSFDEATSAVLTGKAAMAPNWNDQYVNFNDPAKSKVVGKVGMAPMPKLLERGATASCWVMGIPKVAKHPEEAYQWMEFVSRPENATYMFEGGAYAGRASPYEDPELIKKYPEIKTVGEALKYGRLLPKIPEMIKVSDIMSREITKVIAGQTSVKAALDSMESKVDKVMRGAGYYK